MEKPLFETVEEREFTDREKEFKFLWKLVEKAKIRQGASYAIIARKGVGKTALLTKFYNQLFSTQDHVIPFYLSFAEFSNEGQVKLKLTIFISYYFKTLVMQYLAFKLKKPDLISRLTSYDFTEIYEFVMTEGPANIVETLEAFIRMWQRQDYDELIRWVIHFTRDFLGRNNEYGMLMVDEFQILTRVLHDDLGIVDITDLFQKTAEARWCPMVVTGSALYLVTKTVMGGLLTRRFGLYYLEPFSIEYSVEYAFKLAEINSVELTEPVALQIHQLTGGNPFYIWCIFNSLALLDNDLSTLQKLEQVYSYELNEPGSKLKGFWDIHFNYYTRLINSSKIGLRVLYQLATAQKEVKVSNLASYLNEDPIKIKNVMTNLEQADLIVRLMGDIYGNIKDPVLADYIKGEYKTVIMGMEPDKYLEEFYADLNRRQGNLARLLGEAAELYTRQFLLNFKGQTIAARLFGVDGEELILPAFTSVEHRKDLIIEDDAVEFDLIAQGQEQWLIEVKYWNRPVAIKEVEDFIEKVVNSDEWGLPPPAGKRLWFFSRGGFTKNAKIRLQEAGIWHSDLHDFNAVCQVLGIGTIPVSSC